MLTKDIGGFRPMLFHLWRALSSDLDGLHDEPEVLTWRGLATYYVLFSLYLETRRVTLAGISQRPTEEWTVQMARRVLGIYSYGALATGWHNRRWPYCPPALDLNLLIPRLG